MTRGMNWGRQAVEIVGKVIFQSTIGVAIILLVLLLGVSGVSSSAHAGPHVVVDAATGEVYSAETPHQRWAPASLTKMMTSYLAFKAVESGKLTMKSPVFMSVTALDNPPSKMNFPYGTILRLDMALSIIMVKSSNDVAQAIGEAVGGDKATFVAMMNEEAKRLGMNDTHFINPNGLPDPEQYSTAHDLALLSMALIKDFPQYKNFLRIGSIRIGRSVKKNHNRLLMNFPGADGLKTGFVCASGFNLAASAKRDGRHLIAVSLGEPSGKTRNAITARLLAKAFAQAKAGSKKPLPKIDALPRMVWNNNKPADISLAICVRGGRNKWRKGLKTYIKGLQEKYYSPNQVGATVTIAFGGATGPNPFGFRHDNGNRAKDLIGHPSKRPDLECQRYYAKAAGLGADDADNGGDTKGEKALTPAEKKAAQQVEKAENAPRKHEVLKNDDSMGKTVAMMGEKLVFATSGAVSPSDLDISSVEGGAIKGDRPPKVFEVKGKTVTVPQKAPINAVDTDLPFLDRDMPRGNGCIPYPSWRSEQKDLKPLFDPDAAKKELDRKIEAELKSGTLVDL